MKDTNNTHHRFVSAEAKEFDVETAYQNETSTVIAGLPENDDDDFALMSENIDWGMIEEHEGVLLERAQTNGGAGGEIWTTKIWTFQRMMIQKS